LTRYILW